MKQILFILTLCIGLVSNAQYNKWALGADFGVHAVGDQSALVTDAFNHYGITARYSLNPTVSVGVSGGYDNLTLMDLDDYVSETNYARINAEGFIDVFDILDLYSNTVTILAHGGPGYSWIRNDRYDDEVFNLSGGATALFRITDNFAATLGARVTSNITQDKTLDGFMPVINADVNSTVTNFTVGVTFYPGKKKEKTVHADWYVPPTPVYTTNVINNNYITREYVRNITESNCDCDVVEFVFFDHDKSVLLETSHNALVKVAKIMKENSKAELWLKGFASATQSSAEYNLKLSNKRARAVYDKLETMGVDMNRVGITSVGKDYDWADESLHDVSRRVELLITK